MTTLQSMEHYHTFHRQKRPSALHFTFRKTTQVCYRNDYYNALLHYTANLKNKIFYPAKTHTTCKKIPCLTIL